MGALMRALAVLGAGFVSEDWIPPRDVHFALGSVLQNTDVSIMRWGNTTIVHFDSTCTAIYASDLAAPSPPVAQWPAHCVPSCFAQGVAFELDRGLLRMNFADWQSCPEEAARARVAQIADDKNQHLIRDTNVIVFETHSS
jgi:hypothetical protein